MTAKAGKVIEKIKKVAGRISPALLSLIVIINLIPGLSDWIIIKTAVKPETIILPLFSLILFLVFDFVISFQGSLETFKKEIKQDIAEISSKIEIDKFFKKINNQEEALQFIRTIVSQMNPLSDNYFLFSDVIGNLSEDIKAFLLQSSVISSGNLNVIVNLSDINRPFVDGFLSKNNSNRREVFLLQDTSNSIIIGCDHSGKKDILVMYHENISKKIFGFYTNLSEISAGYIEMLKGLKFQNAPESVPPIEIKSEEIKELVLVARRKFIKSLYDAAKGFYTIPTKDSLYMELEHFSRSAKEIKMIDTISVEDWTRRISANKLLPYVETQKNRCKQGELSVIRIHVIPEYEGTNIPNFFTKYELFAKLHVDNNMALKFVKHTDSLELYKFGCVIIDNKAIILGKSPQAIDEYALISYNKNILEDYFNRYRIIERKAKTFEEIKQVSNQTP